MYANDDEVFEQTEVGGLLDRCEYVHGATWFRMFPSEHDGVPITTKYLVVDMKRSKAYENQIEGNTVFYCADRRNKQANAFFYEQIALPTTNKVPVRVMSLTSTGSTVAMDLGDHHVVEPWAKGFTLRRLKSSSTLPRANRYKHPSEQKAHDLIRTLCSEDEYSLLYEPFTINFWHDAVIVQNENVHCYNVDFTIRRKNSHCIVGVEVKKDMSALQWKLEEARVKIRMYWKCIGSPVVLLIVEPKPHLILTNERGDIQFDEPRPLDAIYDIAK